MDITRQSATKATRQQKQDPMEQKSSKPIMSESQNVSENKEICLPPKAKTKAEVKFAMKAEETLKKMKKAEEKLEKAQRNGQAWEAVGGTPFFVGKKNENWVIGCGKYAHPQLFNTKEEAKKYVMDEVIKTDYIMLAMYTEVLIDSKLSKQKMED